MRNDEQYITDAAKAHLQQLRALARVLYYSTNQCTWDAHLAVGREHLTAGRVGRRARENVGARLDGRRASRERRMADHIHPL